jgi:hypothetical protein
MKYTFEHIDILLKDFNALLPMSEKDQRRLDEKFRLEFTYNSNHMEGNTLTKGIYPSIKISHMTALILHPFSKNKNSLSEFNF